MSCKLEYASTELRVIHLRQTSCELLVGLSKKNAPVANQKCQLKNKVRVAKITVQVDNKSARRWP